MNLLENSELDALQAGDRLFEQGDFTDALAAYDHGLQTTSQAGPLLRKKSAVLLALGQIPQAIECYNQLLVLDPNDLETLMDKADALVLQRDFTAALACYESAVALQPRDLSVLLRKAQAQKRMGLLEDTLKTYDLALTVDPDSSLVLRRKADQLLESEHYDQAFELLRRAADVSIYPVTGADWTFRAEAMLRANKIRPALELLRYATTLDPTYVPGWRVLARAQNADGRVSDAFATLNRTLESSGRDVSLWLEKGTLHLQEQQFAAAVSTYHAALDIDPANWAAWANLGAALHNLKQYPEAIAAYDKALELDPRSSDIWSYKGACLEEIGKPEEALACYDRTLEIDPHSFLGLNNKGWVLTQLRRFDRALEYLDKAIAQMPSEQTPWLNKVYVLRELDKVDDAIVAAKEGIAVVDDRRRLLNYFGNLLSDYKDDNEGALACYRQVEELDPASLDNQTCIAEVLLKLGHYRQSRELAQTLFTRGAAPMLQSIARFLILVSNTLEDRPEARQSSFLQFIEPFQAGTELTSASGDTWLYNGLARVIMRSSVAAELKFFLLSLIDLQYGKIKVEHLSYLNRDGSSGQHGVAL